MYYGFKISSSVLLEAGMNFGGDGSNQQFPSIRVTLGWVQTKHPY
jgi:hypothetical protein